MALATAVFALQILPADDDLGSAPSRHVRSLQWLLVATAVLLWLTVLVGTYVIFPPYRAMPPEGVTDLMPSASSSS